MTIKELKKILDEQNIPDDAEVVFYPLEGPLYEYVNECTYDPKTNEVELG